MSLDQCLTLTLWLLLFLITNVLFVVTWYSAKVLKRHTEVKAALEMT